MLSLSLCRAGPPLPSSLTSLFHVVQPLPFSWAPPPDRQLHDLLLLPDVPDAATYFLLCQHPLAHTQVNNLPLTRACTF